MTILNNKEAKYLIYDVKSGMHKISCTFDDHFHIKFILSTPTKTYDLTQNIYSDAGLYKFLINIPFDGKIYMSQSLDRKNDWKECNISVQEVQR